jgi:ribose transport system substrate-binding protein
MLLALDAVGKAGKVRFVGFDGSPPLLEGLAKGQIHALVLQDPVSMGRKGLELLVQHVRGGKVPALVHTDLVLATPENREQPAVKALLQPDLSILRR